MDRVRKIAQSLKFCACKHEDLSPISRPYIKTQAWWCVLVNSSSEWLKYKQVPRLNNQPVWSTYKFISCHASKRSCLKKQYRWLLKNNTQVCCLISTHKYMQVHMYASVFIYTYTQHMYAYIVLCMYNFILVQM